MVALLLGDKKTSSETIISKCFIKFFVKFFIFKFYWFLKNFKSVRCLNFVIQQRQNSFYIL